MPPVQTFAQSLTIPVGEDRRVSGLLLRPERAWAAYVLAHGAGAGMSHPFLEAMAGELGAREIASLRFEFPFVEAGTRRPDPAKLAEATVRAAVAHAAQLLPDLPLFAGGKSFGGRMTSQAQAAAPMPGLRGIAFLGFPLHPAGRPAIDRAAHLDRVSVPMLFLQGTRDALAEGDLMERVAGRLGARATLKLFAEADHSFHVPARSGRTDAEVRSEMLVALAAWAERVLAADSASDR
jgi:predicted alpha/beta-hydrolase family hydrolase